MTTSSQPPPSDHTPQNHHHHHHPNDNIVDYYAIVGVGDTLEFQTSSSSKSRRNNNQNQSHSSVCTTHHNHHNSCTVDDIHHDDDNDDDMERFLREIIHVHWKTTTTITPYDAPSTSSTTATTSNITTTTPQPQQLSPQNETILDDTIHWNAGSLTRINEPLSSSLNQHPPPPFYISYQRRSDLPHPQNHHHHHPDSHSETTVDRHHPNRTTTFPSPAIADLQLYYVRIHNDLLLPPSPPRTMTHNHEVVDDLNHPSTPLVPFVPATPSATTTTTTQHRTTHRFPDVLSWKRCTMASTTSVDSSTVASLSSSHTLVTNVKPQQPPDHHHHSTRTIHPTVNSTTKLVSLQSLLTLPTHFHEWCIPTMYEQIYHPDDILSSSSSSSVVEPIRHHPATLKISSPTMYFPKLIDATNREGEYHHPHSQNDYCYIPVLAIRRQSISNEQRYHEDAALTDIRIVRHHPNTKHNPASHSHNTNECDEDHHHYRHQNEYDDDDENDDDDSDTDENHINSGTYHVLGQTKWTSTTTTTTCAMLSSTHNHGGSFPTLQVRRNRPNGFCDVPCRTRVIGRFPFQNYDTVPLPMEEIPMFCYPKLGCTLYRTQYSNIPLVQYYGFVVKNERGDSIYVSCVSFMEPLTTSKIKQLEQLSYQRRRTSLPHYKHCIERQQRSNVDDHETTHDNTASGCLVTAFTDMTTFENKTICLVSRYPYWTAFRKFLSHLHMITTSSVPSTIPIERYISHLLLSVQLPRPGGPSTIIPLPALNTPMILSLPHEKDLPLLDLPFDRLFSCLNIKTIVTIVLGLLTLERKVIIMSTRPSLVLDVAELLRSLLFPFELCAPYVPRLTEPFKSSLDFPGAIFVGIHDDGDPNGLAAMVKAVYPEESTIIDLDSGEMDCDGDRHEAFVSLWNSIPSTPRTALVNELEALCRDADIVDGQEPLESLMDSAFFVDLTEAVDGNDINMDTKKSLDDRGIRDAFLRFFCSVLGGYERFLVVPDANFLISGDEWFDAPGFLASVSSGNTAYLTSLVSTQLFQSFIQRRTEASDIHCMLFDECLTEFHSSHVPYGRLGGDVEAIRSDESSHPQMLYSLLVDQSATLTNAAYDPTSLAINRSMDASEADSSFTMNMSRAVGSVAETSVMHSESVVSYAGDLITIPTSHDLPPGRKYIYCIDGNPCFPHNLNPDLFLPREPSTLTITLTKNPDPLLARSERELEEANRRRRVATSQLGVTQRRCLWQLPKLFGSHFLGAWLLCTPALVSQAFLSHDQQSKYLLRALGALRLLRSRHRIVPDEAAYRALLVACGRTQSDRRVELVKLFGLLRSDGIFPSAVTLGQYTKALAEGYSKRLTDIYKPDENGVEVTASQNSFDLEESLNSLDTSLPVLEYHGQRWQQRNIVERGMSTDNGDEGGVDAKLKRMDSRMWHPVVYSSSFIPCSSNRSNYYSEPVRLLAMWSRTRCCPDCLYIPLEEEIQAGWDTYNGKNDIPGAIGCPRCDAPVVPMLAFREMSIDEALHVYSNSNHENSFSEPGLDFKELPPQIGPMVDADTVDQRISYVTYINPAVLREALEHYVEEYGDGILDRDQLRDLDLEVFINFWWYCARFSLPLPLPTSLDSLHLCAFAAWDRSTAERGCFSAAKAIQPLFRTSKSENDSNLAAASDDPARMELFDDVPLLSRFNLQGFYSNVWDHPDLSKILVSLVEACDKRDFKGVLESAVRCNKRRVDDSGNLPDITVDESRYGTINSMVSFGGNTAHSIELDIYRVILYLAKYQCTSAFHSFFPTTLKPCKGYHFWCAIGTPLPTFDRLFRDAMRRAKINTRDKLLSVAAPDLTDIALAFRCVFGHLI